MDWWGGGSAEPEIVKILEAQELNPSLKESILRNRFLGCLNSYKFGLWTNLQAPVLQSIFSGQRRNMFCLFSSARKANKLKQFILELWGGGGGGSARLNYNTLKRLFWGGGQCDLKGQCHEIFDFFMNQVPPSPRLSHKARFKLFEISQRYSQLMVHCRYR